MNSRSKKNSRKKKAPGKRSTTRGKSSTSGRGSRVSSTKDSRKTTATGTRKSSSKGRRQQGKETEQKFDRKKKEHRVRFAQNFIKNPALIRRLLRQSSIKNTSRVVEIGPGKGIITKELAKYAGTVVAVERDMTLYSKLKNDFADTPGVQLIHGDFLRRKTSLKQSIIFSNPPFNIFSKVMHKLIWSVPFPDDIYLFSQKEAAQRFCGKNRDYVYRVLLGPWLDIAIVHRFDRSDFVPVPKVDVVLMRITPLDDPLLPRHAQTGYTHFVQAGFASPNEPLHTIYKRLFTGKQWTRICKDRDLHRECTAGDLRLPQWVSLYRFVLESVDPAKQKLI